MLSENGIVFLAVCSYTEKKGALTGSRGGRYRERRAAAEDPVLDIRLGHGRQREGRSQGAFEGWIYK